MRNCPSCAKLSRRQWLAGMSAWAALQAALARGDAQVTTGEVQPRGTAKTLIFINLVGAPSHLDTFDVKDAAWNPRDLDLQQHGNLVLSRTLFPVLSRLTSEMLVLRSVSSWENGHERGQFYLLTGQQPNPAFASETPAIGSVVALESRTPGRMPKFLALNNLEGIAVLGAAFLGGRYEPVRPPRGGFTTLTHPDYGDQGQQRFEQKFRLLAEIEAPIRANPPDQALANHLVFYDSARQMMYDPVISAVFQFNSTDDQRYGGNSFGRSCIVARNAVRSRQGVAFISIRLGNWDMHDRMWERRMPNNMYALCNTLDRGVGNLVEDLRASGHLGETLIVMMGEFGRTPGPLNARDGRDHHRDAMCVAMIGGGVRGGRVIGATDPTGAQVIEPGWSGQRPILMEDLTATFYSALGINWTKIIRDTPTGRIFQYVPGSSTGRYFPVDEVFG
jgi:hypothetical protein